MRKRAGFVVAMVLALLFATQQPGAASEQLTRLNAVEKCIGEITLVLKHLSEDYMRVGRMPSKAKLKSAQQWVRILHTKVFMLLLELSDLNVRMTKREILAKVDEALQNCSVLK